MYLGPMEVIIVASTGLLYLWPVWRICRKAGFPGAIGLLALVPFANIGLLLFLAFAEWPATRHAKPIDRDPDF
ncbi:hypothetical protein V5E97_34020 [Singulisphaera sp. Ch08]|uniref:DUF805 domain-containing protein n=1 Tax=Singulisphaera sp. Ch08 TaxID=3120278 RepID=A0AAU7CD87_9BACT